MQLKAFNDISQKLKNAKKKFQAKAFRWRI